MRETAARIFHIRGLRLLACVFLVNRLLKGTNPKLFELKRRLLNMAGFDLGEGTKVVGPVYIQGKLKTGTDCWIGKNFMVNGNGQVTIGNRCDIGPEVVFQTGGHRIGDSHRRAGEGIVFECSVGDGCWICAKSNILGGSSIGDSTVVASSACVVGDIPSNVLCGGVPARVIKHLS